MLSMKEQVRLARIDKPFFEFEVVLQIDFGLEFMGVSSKMFGWDVF